MAQLLDGLLMAVLTPVRGTPAVSLPAAPERARPVTGPYHRWLRRSVGPSPRRSDGAPSMLLSSTTLPDVELVELARSGDRSAFDELVRRHDSRMRGLAYKLMADRHRMDDALQEAYLKAYRALPTVPTRAATSAPGCTASPTTPASTSCASASARRSPPRIPSTRSRADPAPSGW